MIIADLETTLALLLILSVATERWMAAVTTVFPDVTHRGRNGRHGRRSAVRVRRLAVQALAFVGAWVSVTWIATGGSYLAGPGGPTPAVTVSLPGPLAALAGTGGAVLWRHVLQLAGTTRARWAVEARAVCGQAGRADVRAKQDGSTRISDRRSRLWLQLRADLPDRLDTPFQSAG